ncbi:MAG: alpha-glucosidase C-terminal domain-containing protein [Bacteroidetes bacterium]|nr:alpha-glucosidase C-terminal domain-containing protein [Bacteroidota bacterium]MCW5896421.1 alpha-glucosidase C-terminal domain-containing protein [Bacteroidota bacterium]
MKSIVCLIIFLFVMASSGMSQRISLDGEWLFKVDSMKAGVDAGWYKQTIDRSGWQTVETPRFWEDYPGLATYDGWGWFARTVVVQQLDEPVSLHFAGVDDDAVVWVNGMEVGDHTGYSDPFALDVSKALRVGENLVVVLVKDYAGGGGIYKPITLIETKNLDELLKSPYFGKPAVKSADWVKDACIYSVYLRSFSKEGDFAGLEKRIPELKELGATVLWLMPIHPVGVKNRKGTLGSPYAIRDYYGINPEFGSMEDFKKLLATVHRHGMKLIIDLVANHTAWDNPLITQHPEWYTRDGEGNIIPPNDDWTDVADLDYSQPELRTYMIGMMKWWVKDVGIDGFRCDVAELVPTDFWEDARKELNSIKSVMMLSEGTIPEHHMKAFDITYAWNTYDVLQPLLSGKRPVAVVDELFRNESLQFPVGSLRLRFTTNHDKNAWDAPAVTLFGREGLKLATVFVNTIQGVPLIYNGEEVANDRKLDLFEKVDIDWSRPREVGDIYRTLFRLRKHNTALSRGNTVRLTTSGENAVYAFARVSGKDKVIVVLNFSSASTSVRLKIPAEELFGLSTTVAMKELFSGEIHRFSPKQAAELPLHLSPHGYRVFVVE